MTDVPYILAGSLAQAEHFARQNNIDRYRYVCNMSTVFGIRNGTLYKVGSWFMHKDSNAVIGYALTHGWQVK
jgi:hypothetical protein